MRKIASIVNTSIFQAQVLTEVISLMLIKCENLLKLIITNAENDNSAAGYFKWIVSSEHPAHEVLYDVRVEGLNAKAQDSDDALGDGSSLGDVYKCIKNFVHVEVLSEDYIKSLILRYNSDPSDKNKHKLETMLFKTHHQVFYHIMDILRLVEYLNFKTPSVSLLYHFLNDKAVLAKMKDVFWCICDILGNKEYLDFYTRILDEIEKRVKKTTTTTTAATESWTDWIVNTFNQDDKGKHQMVGECDEDEDNPIGRDEENEENVNDDEDMYIVFSDINDTILQLFATWEKVFILNSKNSQISDCFANLMRHRLGISTKQNEFRNSVENGVLVERSKTLNTDNSNVLQILNVSSILPFLDISLPDKKTNTELTIDAKNERYEHDYLYSIQEFEKVLDLMYARMEITEEEFEEHCDDTDVKSLFNWLSIVHKWCYTTYKEYTETSFQCDDTTKEAFKVLIDYIRVKGNRKILSQYTSFFYPAYGLHILDKYLKADLTEPPKEKLKIKGDRHLRQLASKFQFLDLMLTLMINLMLSQSLSRAD